MTFELCLLTFSVYIGSAIYTAGILDVVRVFNVSQVAATLGLCLFVAYAPSLFLYLPLLNLIQLRFKQWLRSWTHALEPYVRNAHDRTEPDLHPHSRRLCALPDSYSSRRQLWNAPRVSFSDRFLRITSSRYWRGIDWRYVSTVEEGVRNSSLGNFCCVWPCSRYVRFFEVLLYEC